MDQHTTDDLSLEFRLHEKLYLDLVRAARPGGTAAANRVQRHLQGPAPLPDMADATGILDYAMTDEFPTAEEMAEYNQDQADALEASMLAFGDDSVHAAALQRILKDVQAGRATLTNDLARMLNLHDRFLVHQAMEERRRTQAPLQNVTQRPPRASEDNEPTVEYRANQDEDNESTMEYRANHEDMPFVSSRTRSAPAADPYANVTRRK